MADRQSFDAFYQETMPALFRTMLVTTADRELAADATAEAFAKAWQHWEELRNPRAWVWRVAYHYVKRQGSRGNREVLTAVFDERLDVTAEALATAAPAADESDPDLVKAVADLPAQQRAVVACRYLFGLRPRDVARTLGIDRRTESEHHRRAIKTLKKRLADWEGDA